MSSSRLGKLVLLFLAYVLSMGADALPVRGGSWMTVPVQAYSRLHKRQAKNDAENKVPWHLDRIDQRELPLDNTYVPSGHGSGVDIYVFAEGMQYDHKAFGGRASNGGFAPDKGCTRIGTELASLAAGKLVGVATEANVYSINILECKLYTSAAVVVKALDYVVQKANNTQGRRSIIVLPLVGRNSPKFNSLVNQAVEKNIVVVTPAGNHRDDACRYSPGNSPHVINVGATHKNDKLYRYSTGGSNFGDCVSLYAPGQSVFAADEDHGYSKVSGTHAACGIVAGAAALVLEKFKDYTPAEVKQHLLNEATDGVVEIPRAFEMLHENNVNKLLYVGGDNNVEESSASGDANSSDGDIAASSTKHQKD